MSNLYKQNYIMKGPIQYRVINSNQALAEKMEALAQENRQKDGFIPGLNLQQVEVIPPEPEISLEEKKKEAEEIIQKANEEARQLIETAKEQVEAITANAKADGEKLGYEAGRQKALTELQESKARLQKRLNSMEREFEQLKSSLEPQILNAVCDVFEKVFHVQFDQNKEILLHLVRNAILKIESTKEFQVRVNEKNYQYLESHKNEILNQVGQNIKLNIEADASMDETQCVMETDSGFFECGIDVQLQSLIKAIRSLSM